MKRARVQWIKGPAEVLPVIRETAASFTTVHAYPGGTRQETTWWKRTGTRRGALTHTTRQPSGFTDYAMARLLPEEEEDA